MSHTCQAALVTCEDFRLHQRSDGRNYIRDFILSLGVDCDVITRGGCIQDLVRPQPGFEGALLRDLRVSVDLHQAKTVYLVAHEDCGAYRHFGFKFRTDELQQHREDLRTAKQMINDGFPEVEVVLMLAELTPASTDQYVIKPVA